MSQFTLTLPDSLHQQLESLAEQKGIPLNDYLVSTLTSLTSYSIEAAADDRHIQEKSFTTLLESFGEASVEAIQQAMHERENIDPEPDLSSETIESLHRKSVEGHILE